MSKRRNSISPDPETGVTPLESKTPFSVILRRLELVGWPLLLMIAVIWAAWRPIRDPDFWFHLSFARQLVSTGSFPTTDIFGFTSNQGAWVSSGWLASVIMEWLFRNVTDAGAENGSGVLALMSLAGGLAFVGAYGFGVRRGAGGYLAALAFLGVLACAMRFQPRPDTLSLPFLVATLIALLHIDRSLHITPSRIPKSAFFVPIIIAVWANFHAGFLMVLPVLFLFLGWVVLRRRSLVDQAAAKRAHLIVLMGVGSGLVSWVLNPYGIRLLYLPWAISQIPDVGIVYEWKPILGSEPGTSMPLGIQSAFWAALVGMGFMLFLSYPRSVTPTVRRAREFEGQPEAGWWQLATVVLLVGAACFQRRHIGYAILGTLTIVAAHSGAVESVVRQYLIPRLVVPLVAVCISLGTIFSGAAGIMAGKPASGRDCAMLPCHLAEFFALYPPPGNLYNTYGLGGYMTYINGPNTQVFIDGRLDVYPHSVWRDYLAIDDGSLSIDDAVKKYELRTFALDTQLAFMDSRDLAFRLLERPEFRLVHFDDYYSGIVRLDDSTTTYVRELGYRMLNPFNPERTLKCALTPALQQEVIAETKRALAQSQQSATALCLAAIVSVGVSLESGEDAMMLEAVDLLNRAQLRKPDAPINGYVAGVIQRAANLKAQAKTAPASGSPRGQAGINPVSPGSGQSNQQVPQ